MRLSLSKSHRCYFKEANYCKNIGKSFGDSKNIRTFAPPEPAKPLNDAQMCGSFYLCTFSPQNDMKSKIDTLLVNFPDIDTAAMGFPQGWANEPLWL